MEESLLLIDGNFPLSCVLVMIVIFAIMTIMMIYINLIINEIIMKITKILMISDGYG